MTLPSFNDFAELIPLNDPLKRGFYKEQMQAGLVPGWQVKERRAIYLVHRKGRRE